MKRRLVLLAAAAISAAASARPSVAQSSPDRPSPPATPAAKDIDPVGTYELSVLVQGNPMGSTIKLEKKPDGTVGGTVTTEAYGTFAIESFKLSGNTMTIGITTGDGSPVTIVLTLEGDQVSGEWSMSSDGSKITGKKRPPT